MPGQDDDLLVLVDTGFNGELLLNESEATHLNCEIRDYSEAVELADRERRMLKRGRIQILWFGRPRELDLLITSAEGARAALADEPHGLVGTALISPHVLTIDFATRRVVISENANGAS
jgi:hypothetical protein